METSENDVIALLVTRKTAVAALGAMSMMERHSSDPEVTECLNELMAALMKAKTASTA